MFRFIKNLLNPWAEVRRLRHLLDRAETMRLACLNVAGIDPDKEPTIERVHYQSDNGKFDLQARLNSSTLKIFAGECALFLDKSGAKNYLEMRLEGYHPLTLKGFVVTIRREEGKTPNELKIEAETELAKCRKSFDCRGRLMDMYIRALMDISDLPLTCITGEVARQMARDVLAAPNPNADAKP